MQASQSTRRTDGGATPRKTPSSNSDGRALMRIAKVHRQRDEKGAIRESYSVSLTPKWRILIPKEVKESNPISSRQPFSFIEAVTQAEQEIDFRDEESIALQQKTNYETDQNFQRLNIKKQLLPYNRKKRH